MKTRPLIALLTDFGNSDAYVGIMKGVICSICESVQLVDISHEVQPGNVLQAAYLLESAVKYFPPGTVFLVVVDPGVGSQRKAIAAEIAGRFFIGPDNGLFDFANGSTTEQVIILEEQCVSGMKISSTFHGRDIFAPAAAKLASGIPLIQLGKSIPNIKPLSRPCVSFLNNQISCLIVHIDHFGNVITNLRKEDIISSDTFLLSESIKGSSGKASQHLVANGCSFPWVRTFSDVPKGSPLAYWGSTNHLEFAINRNRADKLLSVNVNDSITIEIRKN